MKIYNKLRDDLALVAETESRKGSRFDVTAQDETEAQYLQE